MTQQLSSGGYGHPTTRRHPRTLAEAWPREHAAPIEHYRARPRLERVAGALLAVAIGLGLAASLVQWWSS